MSVLSTPRITFSGQISWDPIVTNNYTTNYDETTGDILPENDPAAKFRTTAIQQVLGGNWNPHGTHRSTFFDTYITGVELGSGAPAAQDPMIGVPVAFSGMLVDLEPYGANTSQLFFDQMSFGIQGGCSIAAQRAFRFTDRYINFSRNTANAMIAGRAGITWQTCFPKENLTLAAHDSPVIQAFTTALQDPKVLGLMVRWQAYRTVYFDDGTLSDMIIGPDGKPVLGPNGRPVTPPATQAKKQELYDKLQTGGWQPNPARSLLVGSVGLWHQDDPIHEPGDRAVLPNENITLPDGTQFGPAFASLGATSITLDLGTFVPDADRDANKHDVGTLSVVAVDPADDKTVLATLGTIPYTGGYDKASYEATAGIVTLSGIPEASIALAQRADLQILDGSGRILATESAQRAIASDPNFYLDEGSTAASTVRVYQRGVPVGKGTSVQLSAFSSDAQGNAIAAPVGQPQSTDDHGYVSYQFTAQQNGVTQYGFGFPPAAPPASLDSTTVTFMSVRVYPSDADIAKMAPTWDNVYKHVLSNWYAMAPCMDNWLLLNDSAMVSRYGPMVKKLTAPDYFEAFRFMPVTRDLSAGKRTLLYNYLDGLQAAPAALAAPVLAAAAEAAPAGNVINVTPSLHVRPKMKFSKNMKS